MSSIHVVTIGDYNDHAVSIQMGHPNGQLPEGWHDATTEITLESGKVKLSSPAYGREDEPKFYIGVGIFELTIRSLNSGSEDPAAMKDLQDSDFFNMEHLKGMSCTSRQRLNKARHNRPLRGLDLRTACSGLCWQR